jgi:16S rRNA (uracil1498-N3)-methyltransferase
LQPTALLIMPPPFFYEENIPLPGNMFVLSEETSKHCIQVLRMHTGEALALTDGRGNHYTATIAKEGKRGCLVSIQGIAHTTKPAKHIVIAMSLLKNASRFEWFLEKAVEIGVSEIIPLISARTERQHFRQDRMQSIVVAAMLQSMQVWLPLLHPPVLLDKLLKAPQPETKLIAHCADSDKQTIAQAKQGNDLIILIGPEGDFTAEEINNAVQQGFIPITLGNTRLRTETAGIVAATLLAC